MKEKWKYDVSHIKTLDGIRALAILILAWFHIWQWSWLQPIKDVPALSIINQTQLNFDWIVRYGSQMVDVMLLISGFCLFLPYAKNMVLGSPEPDIKTFYKKRVARIFPSYYFAVFFSFIVAVITKGYASSSDMWNDLLPHLFFVHTYNRISYMSPQIMGVLWTLAIEVQFYVIFPFVAKIFRKWTWQTYLGMVAISWIFDNWIIIQRVPQWDYSLWVNQLPAFLSVYANGMLAALIYVKFAQLFNGYLQGKEEEERKQTQKYIGYFFTLVSVFCIYVYRIMMLDLGQEADRLIGQINMRYEFSVLAAIFVIATGFMLPMFQKLLANKVMYFLSGISFQIYIWHQYLAGMLKKYRIPYWEGEQEPNVLGDRVWMWKYFLLCWAAALVVAILATYLIEKPCSKWIQKKFIRKDRSGDSK